jgi:hypothetical protein
MEKTLEGLHRFLLAVLVGGWTWKSGEQHKLRRSFRTLVAIDRYRVEPPTAFPVTYRRALAASVTQKIGLSYPFLFHFCAQLSRGQM